MINFAAFKQHFTQLQSDIKRVPLRQLYTFAAALPRFFDECITVQSAREHIRQLLEQREEAFLALAKSRIYEAPHASPRGKILPLDIRD